MRLLFTISIVFLSCVSYAQRYAVASGNWTAAIWASTSNGTPGSAATPTASDDVYTNGFLVTVTTAVQCRNLYIRSDVANSLDIGDNSVTINGELSGATSAGAAAFPTLSNVLVMTDFGELIFQGAGQKINRWRYENPVSNVTFNPGASQTASIATGFRVNNFGIVTISTGTLSIASSVSREIRGCLDCSLTIASGATVNTAAAINGGGVTTTQFAGEENTLFGTITVNGTLITTNYVNSTNFSLGASGLLQTSYNTSGDQTEGWWYRANRPSGGTINSSSTISYNAAAAQNIYARQYGNLTLEGSGTITKTVAGTGSVNISGNLSFLNTGITFTSSQAVIFNGSAAQTITGGGTANLNGGLQINKSGGTFSLSQSISASSITVTLGTFDASNNTITLSGNISNSGTFTSGTGATSGTLIINGSTTVSGATPSFGNLTVNAAQSFSASGTINVAGNITNNGTLSVTGINFNGTSAQAISGSLSLTDITVSNSSGVDNNGTIALTGVLTLTGSGAFDADGSGSGVLTLRSTGLTPTARITTLPNPSLFSGNVTVERYINSPEDWRYLAVPVTNGNAGMWQDDFSVTGNFSNPSTGGNVVNSSSPSIYFWNAPTQAWTAVGSGGTTASTSLSNTVGYSAWSYLSADVVIDVTGTIGKGPVGISLSSGDNLIPNPYPSAIDWDNVSLTGANLTTNTVYVRTGNGTYASYVQGAGTGTGHPLGAAWGGELALGQSFWVISTGGTLTFQEDDKTASTRFVRESQPVNYLRAILKKDNISDDVIIHFKDGATVGTDIQFDALKKPNDVALNLSTYNTDPAVDYAINGIPFIQCEFVSKLKLGSTNPVGNYSLSFEDLSSMNVGYEMVLVDKFLNKEMPITEGMTYPFSIGTDVASAGAGRFEIKFKSPAIDTSRDFQLMHTNNCTSSFAKISIQNSQPGVYYQFASNGIAVSQPVFGDGGTIYAFVQKGDLVFGSNSLNFVASTKDGCNAHEFGAAFNLQHYAISEITGVSATTACNLGTVTLTAEGAPSGGFYRWYESESSVTPIPDVATSQFTTPELSSSQTYFVTAVNPLGCESTNRVPVAANVVQLAIPKIDVNGDVLSVPENLGDYQWYLDNVPIVNATLNVLEAGKSGVYKVSVSANGCQTNSNEITFLVSAAEEEALSKLYSVHPNPVSHTLSLNGPDLENSSVLLFDRLGKQLSLPGEFKQNAEGQQVYLGDFEAFPKGLYLLTIKKGNQIIQLKVIKQ